MADLSIVIPTLNEERFIAPLLESVANQIAKPTAVFVVDGGSNDKTIAVANSFKDRLNVTTITVGRGIGMARNVGAEQAQSKYLLFLDSDVELEDPDFIQKAITEFEQNHLGVASAHFYVGLQATWLDRLGAWIISKYHGMFQYSKRIPMGSGFCLLTTKDMHSLITGFNEEFRHSEDHDYVTRIAQTGATYRILKKPRFKLSNRRYMQQGRATLIALYIRAEINRIFFNYRFAPREEALYNFGIFTNKK